MTSDWRPFDPAPEPDPRPSGSTFRGPSIDGLVTALLRTVEDGVDLGAATRALQLEVWADRVVGHLFERESQTSALHRELARALSSSAHPLAPGVLAALACVLEESAADPLREELQRLRAGALGGDAGADLLGIGEVEPDGRAELVEGDDGWELVLGVAQPGCPHSVGIVVDADGEVRDAFVGPPLADAPDGGAATTDLATRIEGVELDPGVLDDDAVQIWPLVARRLQSVIG